MILDKQIKKIGTQQRLAHKRKLKIGTRIDLKNQNSTTGKLRFRKCDLKYLCWAVYFEFAFENLNTNDSMSEQTFGAGITPKTCTN